VKFSLRLDSVAALRDLRRADDPSPAAAALAAAQSGADAVTAQLRGDRKGIHESDLDLLQKGIGLPFYFDLAPTRETVKTTLLYSPEAVTLVPDKREEPSIESGIDVALTGGVLETTVRELRDHGLEVFVMVDPDLSQIKAAHRLGMTGVRLSTRPYSLAPSHEAVEALRLAAQSAQKVRLSVHAGGGLTYRNAVPIAGIPEIETVHAGSAIISHALFVGLDQAIRDFTARLRS
jgi:pyridoxine 5-phosphate synthase